MRGWRRRWGVVATCLGLAVLLGCGGGQGGGAAPTGAGGATASGSAGSAPGGASQPAPGSSAASGAGAATTAPAGRAAEAPPSPATLQYGMPVATIGMIDLFVAERRGLFAEQGLQVEVITTGPASQTVQALVSGSVDIGSAASDSAINAVERGADLVFVAGAINRVIYSLIGSRGVTGYDDLRGKNVAVSDLRDGSTTLLRRLLLHAGLSADDVNFVPLGGTPNRAAAVTSGQAAAAVMSQPVDFRMMADGYPRLGLSTEAVPNYFFQVACSGYSRAPLRGSGPDASAISGGWSRRWCVGANHVRAALGNPAAPWQGRTPGSVP
jgi:ABC-type amino acid transport substrate-binding protein